MRHHIHRYKQVRAIVERLFEQALERIDQAPQLTLPLMQDHALIRPVAEYGELFASTPRTMPAARAGPSTTALITEIMDFVALQDGLVGDRLGHVRFSSSGLAY